MYLFRLVLCALVFLVTGGPDAFAQVTNESLFYVQRSVNPNEVHYAARVLADGSLDPKQPVDGYWVNKAGDGSKSELTLVQKIAYGWSVEPNEKESYTLKFKVLPELPVTLVRSNGHWRARTLISGKAAYLTRVFVATGESGGMPKVLYRDIFGLQMDSATPTQQRLAD